MSGVCTVWPTPRSASAKWRTLSVSPSEWWKTTTSATVEELKHTPRVACCGMCVQRNAVRPERRLAVEGQQRAHDLDLVEHRRGEDIDARAVLDQQLGDVAPAHVGGRADRRLPVAVAPVQRAVRERGLGGERSADRIDVAVRVPDELLDFDHASSTSAGSAPRS